MTDVVLPFQVCGFLFCNCFTILCFLINLFVGVWSLDWLPLPWLPFISHPLRSILHPSEQMQQRFSSFLHLVCEFACCGRFPPADTAALTDDTLPDGWSSWLSLAISLGMCLLLFFVCVRPYIVFLLSTSRCVFAGGAFLSDSYLFVSYFLLLTVSLTMHGTLFGQGPSAEASRGLMCTSALGFAFLETPQRQSSHRGHEDVEPYLFQLSPTPTQPIRWIYNFQDTKFLAGLICSRWLGKVLFIGRCHLYLPDSYLMAYPLLQIPQGTLNLCKALSAFSNHLQLLLFILAHDVSRYPFAQCRRPKEELVFVWDRL